MRFDIVTLFPELFAPHLTQGITRRAFASNQVDVRLWSLRDFADNAYRRVDDRPYGGGPGMVLLVEPLERALAAIRDSRFGEMAMASADAEAIASADADANLDADASADGVAGSSHVPVVHFSPMGRRLDQPLVERFAASPGAVLICGRYEGIDQRFIDRHVDIELSLGDFVLSGGELPALALLDAVARLQDGVLGDARSHQQDSFSGGLLDCPHYSRPEVLAASDADADGDRDADRAVPQVLMSGHHAEIARWRREQSLALTARRRPDLVAAARARGLLSPQDESYLAALVL